MASRSGKGFNLIMELQDPQQLPALMARLDAAQPSVRRALDSLNYVHFARFLPLWKQGMLLVVTEFDGDEQDYVMDFAAVLDEAFSTILSYMKDAPPLPVSLHPQQFLAYIAAHTAPRAPDPRAQPDPFCGYEGLSLLDIVGSGHPKLLPPAPSTADSPAPDTADVQANVLRGFRAEAAVHLGFEFADAASGRRLLKALSAGVASHAALGAATAACRTIGLTHAGLQALGLPQAMLDAFPTAYREGPALRTARLGDTGRNASQHWQPLHGALHGVISLYRKKRDPHAIEADERAVRATIAGLGGQVSLYQPAAALGQHGEVHFGYRDGIAQPRFVLPGETADSQAGTAPCGDVLLGPRFRNSRGGFYIGALPPELATHGTYAALRVIEQDVKAFEDLLATVARRHHLDPELVAAKLMGRWRNGHSLITHGSAAAAQASTADAPRADDFDYAGGGIGAVDDSEGRRCPFGAHVRRTNPRAGMVLGVPWGRRMVRRGLPYGPPWSPESADQKRGLVGLFLCADLEGQFEFVQHAWANEDVSAPGLRGTQDPFIGAREATTPFTFRPGDLADEITIDVPPLTTVRGSAYLFMPGIRGLHWLAQAGWLAPVQARDTNENLEPMDVTAFDPRSASFAADPYPVYAAFRSAAPVSRMKAPYDKAFWVFSDRLVREALVRDGEFLKPGLAYPDPGQRPFSVLAHFGDGLFFMDPPDHTRVRSVLDAAFGPAIAGARQQAAMRALALLEDALKTTASIDVVSAYAQALAMPIFMGAMGIPANAPPGADPARASMEWKVVDGWIRAALGAHDEKLPAMLRINGANATMAMNAYFLALGREVATTAAPGCPSLMAAMQRAVDCPAAGAGMSALEAMNTARHFALGGYLSTEFLIASGIRNLLSHPEQWAAVRGDLALVPRAVQEMLRFDAPFQLADRWVAQDTVLGGVTIPKASRVTLAYGAANRDPAACPNPDSFDIFRPPPRQGHLGFGAGIHHCIGEPLALAIAEEAVRALATRCPQARILHAGPWSADPYFRSLTRLDLALA